jgi:DNA-binding transcriptional ArsR family regulator
MRNKLDPLTKTAGPDQLAALSSPLRLEILGLFTSADALAVADMATLMGRPAGSLYYHVGLLEKAGLLELAGSRPKGKRPEALYRPTAARFEVETEPGDALNVEHAVKTMASAFRMAERDLEAALSSGEACTEGSERTLYATRMHLRPSPKLLARINKHLQAIEDLLMKEAARRTAPAPDDQHLSLTITLLPLKGRSRGD